MHEAPGFGQLPVEIVEQVIQYLAAEEPPSAKELYQEPSLSLLDSSAKPLKKLSLTCRSLKSLVFPFLFQYLRFRFSGLVTQSQYNKNVDLSLRDLHAFSNFVSKNGLATGVRSLIVYFPIGTRIELQHLPNVRHKLLWFALEQVNPESLTLIASASVMGDIGQFSVDESDMWAFGQNLHVLNLRQPREKAGPLPKGRLPTLSALFDTLYDTRPWSQVTLNEGSCLSAYSTYEYYLKVMPSILVRNNDRNWGHLLPLAHRHIQHFDYLAIFPLPSHMHELFMALRRFPDLVSLSTQITPAANASKDILEDKERLGRASISDLWMEATRWYTQLATDLGTWRRPDLLRKWTSRDDRIGFDDIVAPHMINWAMTGPRVWERVQGEDGIT